MTRIFPVEIHRREMKDEDIGAMAFPSSDDRNVTIPTPEDSTTMAKNGGASIAERRAAKFGFNAVKINTARFRTASPASSPAIRSPYLTIPPGISPAALLDSPIMLHNSLALPSPTTGTLPFLRPENQFPDEDGQNCNAAESSIFKPYLDHKSLLGGATFGNQEFEGGNQNGVLEHQPYTGFEFPTEFIGDSSAADYCREDLSNITIVSASNNTADSKPVINTRLSPDMVSEQSLSMEPVHGEDATSHHNDVLYGAASRSSEDGYNWRKYGQKQVKGSEYPRSYYKCTNPNCQVKKKVERSLNGQITEIIYKGAHNHAKPLPNRRAGLGYDEISEVSEGIGACLRVEGGSAWTNIHSGSDGVEITSSASILTELSDPFSTTRGKSIGAIESAGTPPELSSTVASHDDDEDGAATQGSMSVGGDADGEESESKRRKKESCLVEASLTSRAVREPRVVVQIESEVDILDDGYRWRKYGQKVVKGNPNPRSYYKCTSAGCSVRKHVERASHNLKCVITTYEGKHNHEVPVARNGNHSNSSGGAATAHQPATGNPQPRNPAIPKPETQMQDFPHHQFDRKPEFGTEYLRAGFPGNFGPPSIYQMKFPPLQSYAPFGRFAAQQPGAGPMSSILPDFPMPMPSNLPPPGMVGLDFNATSGYQHHEAAVRFLRPKQEQRDDVVYDPRMSIGDPYNRGLMGGFQS